MNRIALASTTGVVFAGLAALTGCSSPSGPAAGRPAATVTVTATAAAAHTIPASRTTTPAAAAVTSGTPAPPATPAPAASPSWASWGEPSATGTGTDEYVGSGQSVATGREEAATVVAFDLGPCDGRLMYRAVEWYFPQHGQAFRPGQYEDICAGRYVPAS
jgi:hypothetical protein